jgi:hypothetical protein
LFDYDSESLKRGGKGQSLYLSDNVFRHYAERSGYSHKPKGNAAGLRERAAWIFETLLPEDTYTFDAPPWFEWTLRRSADEKELLVHIINRKLNWSLPSELPAALLRCSLALATAPDAVALEPGGESLEWRFDDGRLEITLAPDAVPHYRIIRIVTKTKQGQESLLDDGANTEQGESRPSHQTLRQ